MPDFLTDYLSAQPALREFYARSPESLFEDPLPARDWDIALVEALQKYQRDLGLERSFSGDETVIITGQQPGLFTGPLYTIYKAATAVLAAKKLTESTGRPCVPIYWVAGDDHDFEEVQATNFLTAEYKALQQTYELPEGCRDFPMYRMPLDASLHAQIDAAARECRGSEHTESVCAMLHNSLGAARSVADWHARLMAKLFAGTPLLLFTPDLPAARLVAKTIFRKEIETPLESTRLLNEAGEALSALGYDPLIQRHDHQCNFFLECEGRRRPVHYQDHCFQIAHEATSYSQEELLDLLEAAPERFSANVALRCMVQQHLFPAAAYVAGPGELAYWAQLKPVFAHFSLPMPVVYPRARGVLSTAKLEQDRTALNVDWTLLQGSRDTLREHALQQVVTSPERDHLQEHRVIVLEALEGLKAAMEDDRSKTMTDSIRQHAVKGMQRLEHTLIHADEAQAQAVLARVDRLATALAPDRKPQERVYTVFSFVFEQGMDFVPRLLEQLTLDTDDLQELRC